MDILRDLVAAFTTRPDAIEITSEVSSPAACLWILKGAPEDEAVLIGKAGSHVRALAFLVRMLGQAHGENYRLKLVTEHEPRDREPMQKSLAPRHDPEKATQLLAQILMLLSIGAFKVWAGPGKKDASGLSFTITIEVREFVDYNALTVAPNAADKETIIGALGTLFRAIAKKNGVRYDLIVARDRVMAP